MGWKKKKHHPLMQNNKDHMHVYARPSGLLQNGHGVASSPPGSPSPRIIRNARSSTGGGGHTRSASRMVHTGSGALSQGPPRTFLQKLTISLLTFFLRRPGVLLLAPFIYFTGMVLYIGGSSMELPRFQPRHIPGSYYRSDEVFRNLWPAMQRADVSTAHGVGHLSLSLAHLFLRLPSSSHIQDIPIASLTNGDSRIAKGPDFDIFLSWFSPSSPVFLLHSRNSNCFPCK